MPDVTGLDFYNSFEWLKIEDLHEIPSPGKSVKQSALVENAEREGKRQRIIEMAEFIDEQISKLEEYDEQLVRRLIWEITVFEEKFTVEFKSVLRLKYKK